MLKRKLFIIRVPLCQFSIKLFLLPYRNISKKYAKIGRFLSTTFWEICCTFICHARSQNQRVSFFLFNAYASTTPLFFSCSNDQWSLPSTSRSRVIRIFRVWWIMNQFSVLAVSWNDLGSSWVLTDRLCHWRASPSHHKLSIYLSESQEVLLAMYLEHAEYRLFRRCYPTPESASLLARAFFITTGCDWWNNIIKGVFNRAFVSRFTSAAAVRRSALVGNHNGCG